MPNQEWDTYNDLNYVEFGRKASTFELSLITVCNLKMLSFLENAY